MSISFETVETLKRQYSGKRVAVDARRPELMRLANSAGRVVTFNCSGQAMVQFEGPDRAWHAIDPEFLKWEPES